MNDIDLLASHMAGDYILQTDYMARHKLDDWRVRSRHVAVYTLPFVLIAAVHRVSWKRAAMFAFAVFASHFIIDSRRWASGDNWGPKPIIVDQTLHLITLAVIRRLVAETETP